MSTKEQTPEQRQMMILAMKKLDDAAALLTFVPGLEDLAEQCTRMNGEISRRDDVRTGAAVAASRASGRNKRGVRKG